MTELRLPGCRSRPLLGYLKALGVLRVVARQADTGARGRFSGGVLELSSELDRDAIGTFLLEDYMPTPVLSPWNGRGGFYAKTNASMETINTSAEPRLQGYQEAFARAGDVVERLGLSEQPRAKEKGRLLAALRNELSDDAVEWVDAAVVIVGSELRFPPLLASGGADGSYDFSKNFADALVPALGIGPRPESGETRATWLDAALDATPAELVRGLSGAHFHRDASPVNSPLGEADALGNPWDVVLAIEGCLLLAPGAGRRHESSLPGSLVAPFTVRATAAGYGSALAGEKGRAELWLPLWSGWATLRELETVVREARAQVGRRSAHTGLDFVRSAGELGVARGIESFERYAILERAGQSGLAVPAGRISVRPRPAARAIASLDDWFSRAVSVRGRLPRAAAEPVSALERALFAFADASADAETRANACGVLERLGAAEGALAAAATRAGKLGLAPLRGAPAGPWLAAADDGSPEFAVACGLASLHDTTPSSLPALRDYLHGTEWDPDRRRRRYEAGVKRPIPRRGDAIVRLAALHVRRHLEAAHARQHSNGHEDRVGLSFDAGLSCPLAAVRAFARGQLDDERVLRLVEGLALLSFGGTRWEPRFRHAEAAAPVPAYELLALVWDGRAGMPGARPGWAARLATGHPKPVIDDALLRLRLLSIEPLAGSGDLLAGCPPGPRLAAALLVRLPAGGHDALLHRLTRSSPATEGATP
ncbi:MAG: type I-U CRISPR-associated protein Csx17 [Thermoleophilaceae bacterium]